MENKEKLINAIEKKIRELYRVYNSKVVDDLLYDLVAYFEESTIFHENDKKGV